MSMKTIIQQKKLVLSVHELADVLGVSRPVAYELIKRNGFPAVRVSERRIIIPVEGLCKWLEAEAQSGVRI